MNCAWDNLLGILPHRLRPEIDRLGKDDLQELRFRINAPPQLILHSGEIWLDDVTSEKDISFILNAASQYSPWSATTLTKGFIRVSGGHRIGVCGDVLCKEGTVLTIQKVRSLCIRVARDYTEIARGLQGIHDSVLIIGAPGWGKTTLLRDLIRKISDHQHVAVVDERGELFPEGFLKGKRMDVLTGCTKAQGIEMLLRTMGPQYIAVDEITAEEDCRAIVQAANCGVHLLATCHGSSSQDLTHGSVYRMLSERHIFQTILLLKKDKSYTVERMAA